MNMRTLWTLLILLTVAAPAGAGTPRAPAVPRVPQPPAPVAPPGQRAVIASDGEVSDTLFAVPAGGRLALENFEGAIAVSGWDRNAVRVLANHDPDTRVTVEVAPGNVVVRSEHVVEVLRLERHGVRRDLRIRVPAEVEYQLMVPHSMGLHLSGVNSDIAVASVDGDVSAEAVEGTVTVRGGRGSVRASSINGGVEVLGARGGVEATSVGGDILLTGVQGRVRAESVSGNVVLDALAARAVDASTTTGDVRFAGVLSPDGTYRLSTHSGDLTVVLPERPDVAVDVSTYNGGFDSSFPIPLQELRRGKEFRFALGAGRSELDLESFSGDIRLLRHGETGRTAVALRQDLLQRAQEAEARVREAQERIQQAMREAMERMREAREAMDKGDR